MSKSWYILQTYTGYESKIERSIRLFLEKGELDSNIVTDVRVPIEEVVELKDGKKKVRKDKFLPGYLMLEMDLPEIGWKDTCNKIRHIQGATGFVGTDPNVRPRPITTDEAKNLLMKAGVIKGEKTQRVKTSFTVGDKVKIVGDDAVYSNASDGVKVPDWVKEQILTIDALSSDGTRARLNPIWSWTYTKFLQKV